MKKILVGIAMISLISLQQNCFGGRALDALINIEKVASYPMVLRWVIGSRSFESDFKSFSLNFESYRGRAEYVQQLLDSCDINDQSERFETPLMSAVRGNQSRIVRLLLSRGANPNLMNDRRETSLDLARKVHYHCDQEIIDLLESPEDYECSICFEENYYGEVHSCRHSFHSNCINDWHGEERENGMNPSCPMCRSEW